MTNAFSEEKECVLGEMTQRLSALRLDRVLSPTLKELAIKIGVVPEFRYSAGVVPWTKNGIGADFHAMAGCAWTFSAKLDDSPMSLDRDDGGASVHQQQMNGPGLSLISGTVHLPPWQDFTDCHASSGADMP